MRKPRSYSAEYARRKARALARGLTLSQARGHPRAGEKGLRPTKYDKALETALKSMRSGSNLKHAAKTNAVSRERLSRYIKSQAGAGRSGRAWTFNDQRRRRVQLIEGGQVIEVWVVGYEPARLAGRYMVDAARAIAQPDFIGPHFVRYWENVSIKSASGRRHFFTTDLNEIYRALHANDRPFEQVYKLVMAP